MTDAEVVHRKLQGVDGSEEQLTFHSVDNSCLLQTQQEATIH